MRKLQRGWGLLFISLLLLSCQQAAREKIVEIDFTNGNYSPGIDYFVGVTLLPTPNITAISRKVLRKNKLLVNNIPLELNWSLVRDIVGEDVDYGDYYWFGYILESDFPTELQLQAGESINLYFQANDHTYEKDLIIPHPPQIIFPELDFTEDYPLEWSLVDSVDTQLLSLYYANNDFLLSRFQQWNLKAELRNFMISQSYLSAGTIFEVQEYQIKLENINYLNNNRFLFFTISQAKQDWPVNEERQNRRNIIRFFDEMMINDRTTN